MGEEVNVNYLSTADFRFYGDVRAKRGNQMTRG